MSYGKRASCAVVEEQQLWLLRAANTRGATVMAAHDNPFVYKRNGLWYVLSPVNGRTHGFMSWWDAVQYAINTR